MTTSVFFAKNAFFLRHIEERDDPLIQPVQQDHREPPPALRAGRPTVGLARGEYTGLSVAPQTDEAHRQETLAAAEKRAGVPPGGFQGVIDAQENQEAQFFSQAVDPSQFGMRDGATGAIQLKTLAPIVSTIPKAVSGQLLDELTVVLETQKPETVRSDLRPAYVPGNPLDLCDEKILIDRLEDGWLVRHHSPKDEQTDKDKQAGKDWSPEEDNSPPGWIMSLVAPLMDQLGRSTVDIYGYKTVEEVVAHVREACEAS